MTRGGGFGDRILRLLAERYPIHEDEVALALGARPDAVRFEVKRLAARGLVVVEDVGGKRWVALSGHGALPRPPARADDDPAFQ
ncbi:MAG: hypothetical protein ACYDCK_05125 [Thermoplasmatota archaeon]